MNIFEYASRNAVRFQSIKGLITTEDLWDLPLQHKGGFDLDSVAKAVNAELKATAEESFVTTTPTLLSKELEIKLEIVKHVIAVKLAENEAARTAAARKAEREKLTAILAGKQEAELQGLSKEELQARIDALG